MIVTALVLVLPVYQYNIVTMVIYICMYIIAYIRSYLMCGLIKITISYLHILVS